MAINFGNADKQTVYGAPIPGGTVAKVRLDIQWPTQGEQGDDPTFTRRRSGVQQLLTKLTIISKPLENRAIFPNFNVAGCKEAAFKITESQLKAILLSARGVKYDAPNVMEAATIDMWSDLDGLEFVIETGFDKGNEQYPPKPNLRRVLTPDEPEYQQVMSGITIEGTEDPPEQKQPNNPAPPQGYSAPPQGQAAPPQGYSAPPQGQAAPPQGYSAPPQGQAAPPQGQAAPPQGQAAPPKPGGSVKPSWA
jgi:hypothetical protein